MRDVRGRGGDVLVWRWWDLKEIREAEEEKATRQEAPHDGELAQRHRWISLGEMDCSRVLSVERMT